MAKILPFRPEPHPSTRYSRCLDGKISKFVPISRNAVIEKSAETLALRFPEAWLPFVRWPNATSTNR